MNDSPQAGAQPFLPFDGSHSSNGFASPTESPHDSMNGSYLRHETASVDSVQRLLPNSESIDGMYSNPDNPGFGPGLARANTQRGPERLRMPNAMPVLSEKMNPRSSASAYPRMRGGSRAGKEYAYDVNPYSWDTMDGQPEPDDILHDPRGDEPYHRATIGQRGVLNIGVLIILGAGLLTLFAGYPIISWALRKDDGTKGAFNLGGTNASGQVPYIPGLRTTMIDPQTPQDALEIMSADGSTKMKLVFSDEFNIDGRSFYPGDDPYWEAVDLHYWATNNYEWYDPAAVTTKDGSLQITLDQVVDHNLNFRGGMLQTWNKFCFTGGYFEASVQLPGSPKVAGLWPAVWMMGNLGRAGYGATLEGNWPYSYDSCDVGTLKNQTFPDGTPTAAATAGDVMFNRKHHTKSVSFATGQRLSACTCPGEDHPGPKRSDGSYVGRSAPEIDMFEAQVDGTKGGTVSQSGQWAPFNAYYNVTNTTGPAFEYHNPTTIFNIYTGEVTQQSTSGVTVTPQGAYQDSAQEFATYGVEYEAGNDGYITWVSGGQPSWTMTKSAMDPDPVTQIDRRPFPQEPMYLILNQGISQNFGTPNWKKLQFPTVMKVDYVRVYQPENNINVGCDPPEFPTAAYINRHLEAYMNPNLTLWGNTVEEGGYGQNWPRNKLYPQGCSAPPYNKPGSPVQPNAVASPVPSSEIAVGQN